MDFGAETVAARQALTRVNGQLEFSKPKIKRSARVIPAPAVIDRDGFRALVILTARGILFDPALTLIGYG